MQLDLATTFAYHQRSKHHFHRYAAGPGFLDWATQPDPFRCFAGSPRVELPLLGANDLGCAYADLYRPGFLRPRPLALDGIAVLLELSFGLAAWKVSGGSRWALRCNPSSGNLHPTEAYVVVQQCAGLEDGVYHYVSRDHLLERRARVAVSDRVLPPDCLILGLTSVFWREAWKYGERAWRYCQLDAGHALAAVRYAAATLGWHARLLESVSDSEAASLLGSDRAGDFDASEPEHPDFLLLVGPGPLPFSVPMKPLLTSLRDWTGRANRLSPHHAFDWPVIEEVAHATCKPPTEAVWSEPPALPPPLRCASDSPAVRIIRDRRSGQAYDGATSLAQEAFFRMLDRTLRRAGVPPWDAIGWSPRIHLALFVHRVEGLEPGLYGLARTAEATARLRAALSRDFEWAAVESCPPHLALHRLKAGDAQDVARALSCHQDIAADGAFSLAMPAEFESALEQGPWVYRALYWEAGMVGQVLYLEAEAAGFRGTGIGCFFDDATHELLGLRGLELQDLYHFTVGVPLEDSRLQTLPPYAHLKRRTASP